jgi:SAM-dependent methyltransferase
MGGHDVKQAMREFYAQEATDRDTDAWLEAGGSARVPETPASHYFIDRKVNEALRLARLDARSRVLEVGSSFGHMTFLLAPRFREVVAIDLSPESIELARRRAARYGVTNVRFEVGDAERLTDITPQGFDGIFVFSTLRFCPRPERVLAELMKAVRPGGRVVVDVPNRDCPWYGPLKAGLGIEPHIHDRLYSAREIRRMMEAAGFRDVAVRHILFTSKRVPAALLPLFRGADFVLERIPGVRSTSGIVMAAGSKDGDG